jgi:hypothetical protein
MPLIVQWMTKLIPATYAIQHPARHRAARRDDARSEGADFLALALTVGIIGLAMVRSKKTAE